MPPKPNAVRGVWHSPQWPCPFNQILATRNYFILAGNIGDWSSLLETSFQSQRPGEARRADIEFMRFIGPGYTGQASSYTPTGQHILLAHSSIGCIGKGRIIVTCLRAIRPSASHWQIASCPVANSGFLIRRNIGSDKYSCWRIEAMTAAQKLLVVALGAFFSMAGATAASPEHHFTIGNVSDCRCRSSAAHRNALPTLGWGVVKQPENGKSHRCQNDVRWPISFFMSLSFIQQGTIAKG